MEWMRSLAYFTWLDSLAPMMRPPCVVSFTSDMNTNNLDTPGL